MRFFFHQLKAKQQIESSEYLKLSDGTYTADEEGILKEINRFYIKLYKEDPRVQKNNVLRKDALDLITKPLSLDDNMLSAPC